MTAPSEDNASQPLPLDSPLLQKLLVRAHRRRVYLRVMEGVSWGFLVGLAGAVCVQLYSRSFAPNWPPQAFQNIFLGVLIVPTALAVLISYFTARKNLLGSALAIEQEYALHERLSSALYLSRSGEHFDPAAANLLLKDGEHYAKGVDVKKALPWRRPRATFAIAFVAVLFAASFTLPQWDLLGAEEERQEQAKERERVQQTRKKFDRRIRELREKAKIKKVDKRTQKLLAQMQKREELRTGEQKKSAQGQKMLKRKELANMQKLREQAKSLRNRDEMKQLDAFLKKVQMAGQKLQSQEAKNVAQRLSEGDLEKAATAMQMLSQKLAKTLAEKGADSKEFKQMQRDLEKLAKKMSESPGLAKKLEQLKEMAKSGDSEALEKMAGEMSELAQQAADQLGDLARLQRERELLDSAMGEIQMTEDELAALAQEYPEEELCEECEEGGT